MSIKKVLKFRRIARDARARDLLNQKALAAERQQEISAAYKAYYDNATEVELKEDSDWAEFVASLLAEVPR